jgi:hypothetical protein
MSAPLIDAEERVDEEAVRAELIADFFISSANNDTEVGGSTPPAGTRYYLHRIEAPDFPGHYFSPHQHQS